jgi:hypothetical protein
MEKSTKDWTGNKASTYKIIAATSHGSGEREENDFYATAPKAVKCLMEIEQFDKNIWEPACGKNHITDVLRENGYNVRTSDIIDRMHDGSVEILDFLNNTEKWDGDIITNPPYKYAQQFVEKSLEAINDGHKVAMFMKLTFLEGINRKELFKNNPPKIVWVSSSRLGCMLGGDFKGKDNVGSAVCYCWFVWEKGFKGDPIIKWFN